MGGGGARGGVLKRFNYKWLFTAIHMIALSLSFWDEFIPFSQETIKGTERASPIHTLFHR